MNMKSHGRGDVLIDVYLRYAPLIGIQKYTNTHTQTYKYKQTHTHIHIHRHTHTLHTHTQTHTHTHPEFQLVPVRSYNSHSSVEWD